MVMIMIHASFFRSTTKKLGSQRCDSYNKYICPLYIFATDMGSGGNERCLKGTTGDLKAGG